MSLRNWLLPVVVATAFLASATTQATQVIGSVSASKGAVYATDALGKQRKLRRGRAIFKGDQVETKDGGKVAIRFKDGSQFALGSESSLAINDFVYGQSTEEDTFKADILKGTFRFITGLVAKNRPASMAVGLGVTATIGIRGTNVAGELIGESAMVVLLESDEGESSAIEVFNDHGSVVIDEPSFGTEVADRDTAPTPARRMKLTVISNLTRSIPSLNRIRFYSP